MASKENVIIGNLTMVGIQKWMNDKYKQKKSGTLFTISDIQGYVRRGYLPMYLGGLIIKVVANDYSKTYSIIEIKEK